MKKLLKPFTLIELMIVVAIIAIIAVIAVPNLIDAQRNAKEKAAVGQLKAITTDQATYLNDNTNYATLAELAAADKVDLTGANEAGYAYDDLLTPTPELWAVFAVPTAWGSTGSKNYVISSAGTVRYETQEGNADLTALKAADDADATMTDIKTLDKAK